jgi:hypothetical protein
MVGNRYRHQDNDNVDATVKHRAAHVPKPCLAGDGDKNTMTPLKPSLTPAVQPLCNAADQKLSPQGQYM